MLVVVEALLAVVVVLVVAEFAVVEADAVDAVEAEFPLPLPLLPRFLLIFDAATALPATKSNAK